MIELFIQIPMINDHEYHEKLFGLEEQHST